MALFDSADLLSKCKELAQRPSVDQMMADANWYSLLTQSQLNYVRELATHVPSMMYIQEKLATADSGLTYTFTADPLGHYELRDSPTGRLLIPGPEWDAGADFIPNGNLIRFPGQLTKQFANGPWARYVKTPGVIDASTQPTMSPTHARQVLIYNAVARWARMGGFRDPRPFEEEEQKCWFGNGANVGILGALKQAAFLYGTEALPSQLPGYWFSNG